MTLTFETVELEEEMRTSIADEMENGRDHKLMFSYDKDIIKDII